MDKFFQSERGILKWCSRALDLIILNFIFLICCIPIITIGASFTALYSVTLKMVKDEESYIIKSFMKSFKENMKQATIIWLGMLLLSILFMADYYIFTMSGQMMFTIFKAVLIIFSTYLFAVSMYVFPILARFVFSTKEVFSHAAYLCFRYFPYTILLVAIFFPIGFLSVYSIYTGMFVLLLACICGFALYAFVQSYIFRKLFDKP